MASASTEKQDESTAGSLTDIFDTPALRLDLVTVVALCTDHMRRTLLEVFETVAAAPKEAAETTTLNLFVDLVDPGTEFVEAQLSESRRQQADIDSLRAQTLSKAAVAFFIKWQVDVLRRLGEVLSVRPSAVKQARADAKLRAEALKREKKASLDDPRDGEDDDDRSPPQEDDAVIFPEAFNSSVIQLPRDKRVCILDSILLLLLSLEQYTSHSRVLMVHLTKTLQLSHHTLISIESKVANGLLESAAANMSADESTQKQASSDATSRKIKIGLAAVGGAVLVGITGGLAAPVLAAGLGSIMGGLGFASVAALLGPLATNVVLVGGLFGAYGGRMTSKIMEKYAQEVRDFKLLPVNDEHAEQVSSPTVQSEQEVGLKELQEPEMRKTHKLRVVIGISGQVAAADDFTEPWKVFSPLGIEPFGLRWEMDALIVLSRKTTEVLREYAWNFAKFRLASLLVAGLWPIGLLRTASLLDHPFALAKTRADKAGKILADALINKVQGERPVTLVGYSLGARVIYSCLLQLAEQKAFGLVESVVLMGAPTPSDFSSWRRIRAVVTGRLVNVYSADDYMLGFLYRATAVQSGIAGVQAVTGVNHVENYDLTHLVGRGQYKNLVGTILECVEFTDIDRVLVQQQQDALREVQQRSVDVPKTVLFESPAAGDVVLAREDEAGHIVLLNNEDATAHPLEVQALGRSVGDGDGVGGRDMEDLTVEGNDKPMTTMQHPDPEPDDPSEREPIVMLEGGAKGNAST